MVDAAAADAAMSDDTAYSVQHTGTLVATYVDYSGSCTQGFSDAHLA